MTMFSVEVHTAEFEEMLTEVQLRVHTMSNTLMEVARLVESNTEPLVPYDFDKRVGEHLVDTFVAVPTGKATKGWVEVEIGYSVHDPRDGYDYAEYTHTGIDYRTGGEIRWHKATAQREYLVKGIVKSESEAMKLIENDYLSMFGGLGRVKYG